MPDGDGIDGISLVPQPSRDRLNERQIIDYRNHRKEMVKWLLNLGKDPSKAKGYAHGTVKRRAHNLDIWYRYVWDEHTDGYTTSMEQEYADEFMQHLAYKDMSDAGRSNYQKALKCYWRWQDDEWDPNIKFNSSPSTNQPRDYLTRSERDRIREASLEYGTVPSYNNLTPTERTEWKRHLAQRFKKPMDDITPEDFQKANGFKVPSIVYTSLDAALRPIEVGRAKVSWVDLANEVLRIPAEESSKNSDNWVVSLRTDTTEMLARWLEERQLYEKYDDSDRIWLTRKSTAYGTRSLKYLLRRLCNESGINYENRQMTWYCLRHSTGTFMTREEGLKAAASQLRHTNIQTTTRYDAAPPDDRRDALDNM